VSQRTVGAFGIAIALVASGLAMSALAQATMAFRRGDPGGITVVSRTAAGTAPHDLVVHREVAFALDHAPKNGRVRLVKYKTSEIPPTVAAHYIATHVAGWGEAR
jgi:hypothetical protein